MVIDGTVIFKFFFIIIHMYLGMVRTYVPSYVVKFEGLLFLFRRKNRIRSTDVLYVEIIVNIRYFFIVLFFLIFARFFSDD